ncbi:MAG: hypothetical protein ACFFDW_15420 [Candidatus Thorarchaeota archaeon]
MIGTILLTGVIISIDFLYAGIQELFLSNVNPDYIPDVDFANRVIIACSITIGVGIVLFILNIWLAVRKQKIQEILIDEQIVDEEGSVNFNSFQTEIINSLNLLKDLFGFIIIIVVISALFSFLRFIWMIGKYRVYNEFFIHYFFSNVSSLVISISIYLTISIVMTYVILISLQRYNKLRIITKNYESAMDKALKNFDSLLKEESSKKVNSEKEISEAKNKTD